MKINRNITKIGVLALAILAASVACKSPVQPGGVSDKLATLSVAVGGAQSGQKTLLPAALLPSALTYDLMLTRSGYTTVTKTSLAYDAIAAADLEPGAWNLALTAYSGTDAVFSATQDVTLGAGPNAVSVLLDPIQTAAGTGSFTYELNLPAGNAYNAQVFLSKVKADIQSSDAAVLALIDKTADVGVSNDLANTTAPKLSFNLTALESGVYYLRIDLRRGAVLNTTLKATKHLQLVYIYNNRVSTAPAVTLTDAELGSAPAVPSGLVFSVSGSTVTLAWTDNSNTEEKFYVYRDGTKVYEVIGGTSGFSYVDAAAGSGGASDAHTYEVSAWNEFGESARASGAWQGSGTLSISLANKVITFTPATVSVVQGTALSVTTNAGAGFSGWKWYRDGTLDALNTTSVYTWTPAVIDVGLHILSASVLYNGLSYSGDLTVSVVGVANAQYSLIYSNQGADFGTAPIDAKVYSGGQSDPVLGNTGNLTKVKDGISLRLAGWCTTLDGSGDSFAPGATVTMTATKTLYAQWTSVGGIGPAGGYVFYDQGSVINGWRYLEAARTDQSSAAPWSTSDIVITTPNGIGNGLGILNTNAIIAAVGNSGSYAAKLCADLAVGGYDDWYLPTVFELQQMNLNLHHAGLGGFTDNQHYWTSMYGWNTPPQNSYNYHIFSGDTPAGNGSPQSQSFFVRAVRSFKSGNPTYSVTYDGNGFTGGAVPLDIAGYEAGDTVTVKTNSGNLVKTGQYFAGWNTAADGSGQSYSSIAGTFTIGSANVTLYAQWGNLYISGAFNQKPGYWINGAWTTLPDIVTANPGLLALGIVRSGSDLYLLGTWYDDWYHQGVSWANGTPTLLTSSEHTSSVAFAVDGGTVYSAGYWRNATSSAFYRSTWIDGVRTDVASGGTDSGYYAIARSGGVTYVGGFNGANAIIKVGSNAEINLLGGTAVYSMAVSGSTVYAAGTNGGTQAVYWKSTDGGITFTGANVLWAGGPNCFVSKIFLSGSDFYAAGGNGTIARYSKNLEPPINLGNGQATSITVNEGNVYVAGTDLLAFTRSASSCQGDAGYKKAFLWVNGILTPLATGTSATLATDIIFVP